MKILDVDEMDEMRHLVVSEMIDVMPQRYDDEIDERERIDVQEELQVDIIDEMDDVGDVQVASIV